ncbi:MAG TPA: hypothetical protein VFC78_11700 [Tepidisphaeraceae bacterium]|nr:hypothetical protein [Tepidisphaeraceae bacterium]
MLHRHINTADWTLMAIESLFERGELADWKEFVQAMKKDARIAERALQIAATHEDTGSAALARILVTRVHPRLLEGASVHAVEDTPARPPSIFDFIGKAPVKRSAQDIDQQIREERDSWGDR